ncbi:MAG: L,D-transpeptidase family protein [Verrucomicrobiota bacterium]
MKAKSFEELQQPSRKPWLIILLLVLIVIFFAQRCASTRRGTDDSPKVGREREQADAGGSDQATTNRVESIGERDVDWAGRFDRAVSKEKDGKLVEARNIYLNMVQALPAGRLRKRAEQRLGRINIKLVMTPRPMPEKVDYIVKSGDQLQKIARKFGTTVELIQVSNGIKNRNMIKPGDRLRILEGDFSIIVSKSNNDLELRLNGGFFKRYEVGTGKFGRTPEGTFKITNKIPNPPWYRPDGKVIPFGDDDNILGTRWMSLKATGDTSDARGYGIHGTWEPESIGKAESAGCVRMRNDEVEELFVLVPRGTPVVIKK